MDGKHLLEPLVTKISDTMASLGHNEITYLSLGQHFADDISDYVLLEDDFRFYPSALQAGGVLSSRSRQAGGQAAARLVEPISL